MLENTTITGRLEQMNLVQRVEVRHVCHTSS
jgi:hypothetical protein